MTNYYNPFQGEPLFLPEARKAEVDALVHRSGKGEEDKRPFFRTVDVWFLSALVGARLGLKPVADPQKSGWKFNEGTVFKGDEKRILQLELLAIGLEGDAYVIKKPADVIKMVNRYAAAGLPELLGLVQNGKDSPLWNLTANLEEMLSPLQQQEVAEAGAEA